MADSHLRPSLRLEGERDRLFLGPRYPHPFSFNEDVVAVFDDMVSRSVPLYAEVTHLSARWAQVFYQPGTRLYDLGCSTGTTLELIGKALAPGAQLVGMDASQPMLEKAAEKLAVTRQRHRVELFHADLREARFEDASFAVVNYTLQFLPVAARGELIKRLVSAMVPGGVVFISEKVRASAPVLQETIRWIHEEFKEQNGYSELEIARKKEALENVLVPQTEDELKLMLKESGCDAVETIARWHNFLTVVGWKKG